LHGVCEQRLEEDLVELHVARPDASLPAVVGGPRAELADGRGLGLLGPFRTAPAERHLAGGQREHLAPEVPHGLAARVYFELAEEIAHAVADVDVRRPGSHRFGAGVNENEARPRSRGQRLGNPLDAVEPVAGLDQHARGTARAREGPLLRGLARQVHLSKDRVQELGVLAVDVGDAGGRVDQLARDARWLLNAKLAECQRKIEEQREEPRIAGAQLSPAARLF
jgi:hypothetical protein